MLETAIRSPRSPAHRRPGRRTRLVILAAAALVTAFLLPASTSGAADAPVLGTADSFAVLGHTTVTNTGPTVINGDLGVSPGTAITGFPPGLVNGATHNNDAVAAQAGIDAEAAYTNLAGQGCDQVMASAQLGGLTLVPGVYCFTSSAQLTGALTLDAQGVGGAVFVFKIVSTLTTASNSSVLFINGANPCNVYWQVGSSATLGTGTDFAGTTIARASISATTGTDVTGRLLALDGAVTLDTNVVSATSCATGGGGGGTTTTTTTPATTTTTAPTTTTTVGAATDTGTDGTTGGATTGGATDGTTGGGTTGGTTGGGTPRTDLPATGNDGIGLPLFGAIAVALGVIVTGSSGAWRRSHLPQPKHLKD